MPQMENVKQIVLAADHAGFDMKEKVKKILEQNDIKYFDASEKFEASDDYPDVCFKAAKRVARERTRGIFVCGSGIGMSICANRVKGIRAAVCHSEKIARLSRQHNDSNVLCLAGKEVDEETNIKILKAWLTTGFLEGRHSRRVEKIAQYEKDC